MLTHLRDDYGEVGYMMIPKEDKFAADQVEELVDIGYKGYPGYELCHPLAPVDGRLRGVD